MKKLLSLVLSFLLLASLCPALADTPPADQIAASGKSYVEWYDKTRTVDGYISYIKAGIEAGQDCVLAMGRTEANMVANTVGITLCIERWENSQWNTYTSYAFNDYDVSEIFATKLFDVEGGHYYRLYAIHKVYHAGERDFEVSITNSVYVN